MCVFVCVCVGVGVCVCVCVAVCVCVFVVCEMRSFQQMFIPAPTLKPIEKAYTDAFCGENAAQAALYHVACRQQ